MKKTLLAAALVAGFAGVAQAESSVTLYGVVDAGLGYDQTSIKNSNTGVTTSKVRTIGAVTNVQSGSRWGLKGVEDLGNGTSAIFQLESGFDPGTGNSAQGGRLFGRKAILGLTGESWGTFTIGRQYNVADDLLAPIDPFDTGFGLANSQSTFGDAISARQDATLKYMSPNFEGFKFGVSVGYSDNKTTRGTTTSTTVNKNRSTVVSAGLAYDNGPLTLAATYDYDNKKETSNGNLVGEQRKAKAWNIGAAYDFDVVKLHLIYGQQRDGVVGGNFGGLYNNGGVDAAGVPTFFNYAQQTAAGTANFDGRGLRQQAWLFGLSAPVTEAGKVMFSYQGGRTKHNAFNSYRSNAHIFSLGYTHNLSKRTNVYVVGSYGYAKSKQDLAAGQQQYKLKSTYAAVGLRHRF